MRAKAFNLIILLIIFSFTVVFGVFNFQKNNDTASQDNLFQTDINAHINDITKRVADDINTTQSNLNNNNSGGTSSSPNLPNQEVKFSNFYQMYNYALDKYNGATYIYSYASGTGYVTGEAKGLIKLENEPLTIKFSKQKAKEERYFGLDLLGRVVVPGMNALGFETAHYSDGVINTYSVSAKPTQTLTRNAYENELKWNMTEIFNLPTREVVSNVTEEEIISFLYDSKTKEYTAVLSLRPEVFKNNFNSIVKILSGSTKEAVFSRIDMTIKVDRSGNFKTIHYSEKLASDIVYKGITMQGEMDLSFTETFSIIDNGFVRITNRVI